MHVIILTTNYGNILSASFAAAGTPESGLYGGGERSLRGGGEWSLQGV